MMRIGSCTVLYNPDQQVLKNLETYIELVDVSVIVDNSDKKNEISNSLRTNPKIHYIDMHGNEGIAAALNRGIEYLEKQQIEYALTMDQDSQFPMEHYSNIKKFLDIYKDTYSVIGLNFNNDNYDCCDEKIDALYWLTSGNFVNINDFMRIGEFDERLFIDYVDIELGYKLNKNNLKLCYLKGYSLKHKIGNPIEINFFGRKYYAMNHSPIRYYYRYRNSYYLYLKDKHFFRKEFFKEILVNIPKMIFFEKRKREKFKMIFKGLKDAKEGKLGKYNEKSI